MGVEDKHSRVRKHQRGLFRVHQQRDGKRGTECELERVWEEEYEGIED